MTGGRRQINKKNVFTVRSVGEGLTAPALGLRGIVCAFAFACKLQLYVSCRLWLSSSDALGLVGGEDEDEDEPIIRGGWARVGAPEPGRPNTCSWRHPNHQLGVSSAQSTVQQQLYLGTYGNTSRSAVLNI